jgi:tripeptide aminopeptidase
MTLTNMPSRERLSQLFQMLVVIPSPSWSERAVADVVIGALSEMGLLVREDATGKAIGGDCGNLVCTVGDKASTPCLALGAHMDTVTPTGAIDAVLDVGGRFSNANNGILGADDKAAIAALLHAAGHLSPLSSCSSQCARRTGWWGRSIWSRGRCEALSL